MIVSIKDLLARANEQSPTLRPKMHKLELIRVQRDVEDLTSRFSGRFVVNGEERSVATFSTVSNAVSFQEATLLLFKERGFPFKANRVGAEVRITWVIDI
jgi:hypothetical protein